VMFKDYLFGAFIGLIPGSFIHLYLFEAVLGAAFVGGTEGSVTGMLLESFLAENLMTIALLEQGFIWLILLILTRLSGGILLWILVKRSREPHLAG